MRFQFDFTVPAGTPAEEPCSEDVKLSAGTLIHAEIGFPPGPSALVNVQVLLNSFQIVPATPGNALAWDDLVFAFPMDFVLSGADHELTLVGWSPDAYYDHTITFWFDVSPPAGESEIGLLQKLFGALGLPAR